MSSTTGCGLSGSTVAALTCTAWPGCLTHQTWSSSCLPSDTTDAVKAEITRYADGIVSTCYPAVLPDGSNVDDAPAPKTDSHMCNQVYGEIQDFDTDLADLVATCQRHTQCSAAYCLYVHETDDRSVALATPSLYSHTQLSSWKTSQLYSQHETTAWSTASTPCSCLPGVLM